MTYIAHLTYFAIPLSQSDSIHRGYTQLAQHLLVKMNNRNIGKREEIYLKLNVIHGNVARLKSNFDS